MIEGMGTGDKVVSASSDAGAGCPLEWKYTDTLIVDHSILFEEYLTPLHLRARLQIKLK
jgi:hypothetical protein